MIHQTRTGIVLAGGTGTRLYPLTKSLHKHLLPVYDKPMIYYPLSVLMLAGLRDIVVVTSREELPTYQALLGNGSSFGIRLEYATQFSPRGLADAIMSAEPLIGASPTAVVLGDNIFYGQGFSSTLRRVAQQAEGATAFGYQVMDPERFGVVEIDAQGRAISIEEKPTLPKSNLAVTGLYFYDSNLFAIAKGMKPSARGELEITAINNEYLCQNLLKVEVLGRGYTWIDTGTHESLFEAGVFVRTVEHQRGYKIACLEEIGFNQGWLDREQLLTQLKTMDESSYSHYLRRVLSGQPSGDSAH